MPLQLPDFLQETNGEIHFAGTRVGIHDLLHFYHNHGFSAEMLAADYPSVKLPTIYKFLAFYVENARDIDARIAVLDGELEALRAASPDHVSLADLRKRFIAAST